MEKINWINGQAGGTPLSAENLNQMQDNIEKAINENTEAISHRQNIITAYIEGTTSTAGVEKELTFAKHCKVGNKLSIESGKVIIGADIKKVLVSAKALFDDTQLTSSFFYLWQNNNIINRSDVYGTYNTIALPPLLVEVEEGDSFFLTVTTGTNANIYEGTYITVEVIE